jgi:hypothetical protein
MRRAASMPSGGRLTDTLGRPVQVATTVNGATYTMSAGYDGNSRLTSVSYASGFTAKYA